MRSIALLASAGACALALGASPATAKVCPYSGTVDGQSVLIYCGSAKATVRAGTLTLSLKNGQCKKAVGNFYLGFGSIVTQQSKHAPDSFQLIAGSSAKPAAKDGSYTGTTVMMTKSGKSYLADALTLTLTHGTRAGAVTGTIEPIGHPKVPFHATFTC